MFDIAHYFQYYFYNVASCHIYFVLKETMASVDNIIFVLFQQKLIDEENFCQFFSSIKFTKREYLITENQERDLHGILTNSQN